MMSLYMEEEFKSFPHCQFKETVVRVLLVPSLRGGFHLVAVSKFGAVGIFESNSLRLICTYILDWAQSVDMKPSDINAHMTSRRSQVHIVSDAVYADDLKLIVFATTRGQLQCYDIGEIETYSMGLEILPRQEFKGLKKGKNPCKIRNEGHVETHRIVGLVSIPSCLAYLQGRSGSKILIGDFSGGITIIAIRNCKTPFGNHRKMRGKIHQICIEELQKTGVITYYKGHNEAVKDILILEERLTVATCSRDKNFSVVCKDLSDISETSVSSFSTGATCLAYSDLLKILIAGCDDGILRIFNYMDLSEVKITIEGHKSAIVGLQVLNNVSDDPLLVSYSEDVELQVWNMSRLSCIQKQFLKFPRNLPIICKTPEFGKKPIIVNSSYQRDVIVSFKATDESLKQDQTSKYEAIDKGFLVVLYSNCYAKVDVIRDDSSQLSILSILYDELHVDSVKKKRTQLNKNPKTQLTNIEEEEIASRLATVADSLLSMKYAVEKDTDPRIDLISKQIVRWEPKEPSPSRSELSPLNPIKVHGIYHNIPYFDVKDPECSINYKPSDNSHVNM